MKAIGTNADIASTSDRREFFFGLLNVLQCCHSLPNHQVDFEELGHLIEHVLNQNPVDAMALVQSGFTPEGQKHLLGGVVIIVSILWPNLIPSHLLCDVDNDAIRH